MNRNSTLEMDNEIHKYLILIYKLKKSEQLYSSQQCKLTKNKEKLVSTRE